MKIIDAKALEEIEVEDMDDDEVDAYLKSIGIEPRDSWERMRAKLMFKGLGDLGPYHRRPNPRA